jgi:hypothetical protein
MADIAQFSAAVDRAIAVLESHGHMDDALILRRDGPEVFRLARRGERKPEPTEQDRK